MQVVQTPRFARQCKKLKPKQKQALDKAIKALMVNPMAGRQKCGDLNYLRVYKFFMLKQQVLLAYSYDDGQLIIKLLAMGSHENFYRDLKR